jgi:hypothetical protein
LYSAHNINSNARFTELVIADLADVDQLIGEYRFSVRRY